MITCKFKHFSLHLRFTTMRNTLRKVREKNWNPRPTLNTSSIADLFKYENQNPMLGNTGSAHNPTFLNAPSHIGRSGYTNPRHVTFQDSRQEFQIAPGPFTRNTDRFSTKLIPKLFCAYTNKCTHCALCKFNPQNEQTSWHILNMLHTGISGMTVRKGNA